MLFRSYTTRLGIDGLWLLQHPVHKDARGTFREWFRKDELFIQTGINFEVVQTNNSLSKKATIRGVHYSSAKGGQAKLVTCIAGSIFDAVIDIRPNSPTFKKWVGIELNANSGNCLLISGGLGHAFQALENETAVDRKSTRLNSSHTDISRMPSSA